MNNNMSACGLQALLSLSLLAVHQRDLACHGQVMGETQTESEIDGQAIALSH